MKANLSQDYLIIEIKLKIVLFWAIVQYNFSQ